MAAQLGRAPWLLAAQLGSAMELGLKRPGPGAIVAGCPFCRQSSGYWLELGCLGRQLYTGFD